MSKLLSLLITSCLALLFAAISLSAQTATATLSGTILDQNGSVIAGVSISVINDATAQTRTATTNESGLFTVPLLPPGKYSITARHDGFTTVKVPDVVLNVGDQKAKLHGLRYPSAECGGLH